jgi:hypothetical protein
VTLAFFDQDDDDGTRLLIEQGVLRLAWEASLEILGAYGGPAAAAYLKVLARRNRPDGVSAPTVDRWITMESPDADSLASVEREFRRARGEHAWEAP